MAGASVPDAGEEATCPRCGSVVLQKKMVPVLADGGGHSYLCAACARELRPEQARTMPRSTLETAPAAQD